MTGGAILLGMALWLTLVGWMAKRVEAGEIDDPSPAVGFGATGAITVFVFSIGFLVENFLRWLFR